MTEEKRSELEDYAEYAELILGVLGYKVFEPVAAQPQGPPAPPETPPDPPVPVNIPALPSEQMKIGEFVYTAMQRLGESGFQFSDEAIDAMSTPEWSTEHFHTNKPFMKKYIPGLTDNKGADGRVRFKSTPFAFGSTQVLISKEWFERQRQLFINWYRSLEA